MCYVVGSGREFLMMGVQRLDYYKGRVTTEDGWREWYSRQIMDWPWIDLRNSSLCKWRSIVEENCLHLFIKDSFHSAGLNSEESTRQTILHNKTDVGEEGIESLCQWYIHIPESIKAALTGLSGSKKGRRGSKRVKKKLIEDNTRLKGGARVSRGVRVEAI